MAVAAAVLGASAIAVHVVPAGAAVPIAPVLRSVTPGPTTGVMTLRWTQPIGGAAVTSYRAASSVDGVNWGHAATVASGSATLAAVACPAALVAGHGCAYRIYSANASGASGASNVLSAVWTLPGHPQNLHVNAGPLPAQATLKWAAPASNGGLTIDLYRYEWSLDGNTWTLGSTTGSPSGTVAVPWCSGLSLTCLYRMRAHNNVGLGGAGTAVSATMDVPAAVQTISASATTYNGATGVSTVTVAWNAPDTNGLPVDDYNVQFCGAVVGCSPGNAFWDTAPIVDRGTNLNATTTCPANVESCAYQVRAHNVLGWGPWRHQYLAPYAPTLPDAVTGTVPGGVDLSWTATQNGGAGIGSGGYIVLSCNTACNNNANWSDTGLHPGGATTATHICGEGVTCTYRIGLADTLGHRSLLTSTVSASGSLFAGPPQQLVAVSGATLGSVGLSWNAAAAPAGLPVTGYQIERDTGLGFGVVTTVGAGQLSYTDGACGAAVACAYRVRAQNATGLGFGALANAIGAGPPSAPQNFAGAPGVTLGGTVLVWAAPLNDGGHAVSSYALERNMGGGWQAVATTAGLFYFDTGCAPRVSCQYRIAASNTFGAGPFATVSATGADVPDAPVSLAAQPGTTQGSVSLSWSAPAFNGGRAVNGYAIQRDKGLGFVGVATVSAAPTQYVDKGCGAGNLCTYRVAATNPIGTGATSGTAAAIGSPQSTIHFSSVAVPDVNTVASPIAGNFNGDAYGDILWYAPGTAADKLWLGAGGGAFVNGPTVTVNGVYKPVTGDFNGDGATDVLWYAPGTAADHIWLGGSGGFHGGPAINVNGSYTPIPGDFNGDGRGDVFWYSPGTSSDYLWVGTVAGGLTGGPPVSVNGTYRPIPGDFDGNGYSDILWYAPGAGGDVMWLGGASGFHGGPLISIHGTYTPIPGDFDGDGRTDVFWYAPGKGSDLIWLGTPSGALGGGVSITVNGVYIAAAGDYDGNSKTDIDWYTPTGHDYLWLSQ